MIYVSNHSLSFQLGATKEVRGGGVGFDDLKPPLGSLGCAVVLSMSISIYQIIYLSIFMALSLYS